MSVASESAKTRQRQGSYHFAHADTTEWLARVPTVGRCLFCPTVRFRGTAAEVVEAQQAHRAAEHPWLRSMSQRERKAAAKAAA